MKLTGWLRRTHLFIKGLTAGRDVSVELGVGLLHGTDLGKISAPRSDKLSNQRLGVRSDVHSELQRSWVEMERSIRLQQNREPFSMYCV